MSEKEYLVQLLAPKILESSVYCLSLAFIGYSHLSVEKPFTYLTGDTTLESYCGNVME